MNQTAAYLEFAVADEYESRQEESLLKKISDRIVRALRSSRREIGEKNPPVTFIEANLLDDNLGPEISRTLRI